MELKHFSHIHPLVFNEEPSHRNDKANCSGCGEHVLGPSFSCMACGFYLDKKCVEAPPELAHPFHRNHNLNLLNSYPYGGFCDFCHKNCENFVYQCSCNLNLHIKCALFLYNIAQKKVGELQIAHIGPLISTEAPSEELKKAECFVCWKPLLDSAYLSLDSGFCLHKKCVELPLEINHVCHRQHSLFLQFNNQSLPCLICCQQTQLRGFVYYCSPCLVVLHIECVPPIPSHIIGHPFSQFFRQVPFICDACGTSGNNVSYICSTCSLMVHKECISLPRIIESIWHHHPISHKYFVVESECGTLECGICHEEVNKVHGSYYCSECKFIVHVKCALKDSRWYHEIDESSKGAYEKEYQLLAANDPSFVVIREINLGENVISREIKHFGHEHNLVSSDKVVKDERSYCDGCSLLINTPFYHCSQCPFFLHKSCAELPKKTQLWYHIHFQQPLDLVPNVIFNCWSCREHCSGFAYRCEICENYLCVHCAKTSYSWRSQGHDEHLLLAYHHYTAGECNACGVSFVENFIFRCKVCNFNVHGICSLLPQTAAHKCDEHVLKLTYHESNDYSEYHYCDICEERRNPSIWFYHCTICNTSAHLECAVQDNYPFVKRGIRTFLQSDHPHDLVVVEKVYDYPEACCKCGKPCLNLALQCSETGCNYIIHWRCSKLSRLGWLEAVEYK